MLLGRTRKSIDRDLSTPQFCLSDLSLSPLDEAYRNYEARVAKADAPDESVLILKPKNSDYELRLTIDSSRHVLLKMESFEKDKLTGTTTYSDFAQIAGTWW